MGILDDPLNPYAIEILRRSVAMLRTGQQANIDRDQALALLRSLQELEGEHREVIAQLRSLLTRLEGG